MIYFTKKNVLKTQKKIINCLKYSKYISNNFLFFHNFFEFFQNIFKNYFSWKIKEKIQ